MLNQIEELDKERVANRRRRITNGYIRRRALGDVHLAALKERRLQLDEARLELNRAEHKGETLKQQYRQAQARLVDAQVALQTDETARRERELTEKIAAANAEVNLLRQRKSQGVQSLKREVMDAQRLLALFDQTPAAICSGNLYRTGCRCGSNRPFPGGTPPLSRVSGCIGAGICP